MQITAEQLEAMHACADGVALFRRYAGQVYEVDDYSLDDQLAIIRGPLGRYWGWAARVGLLPAWSMAGANLAGANLWEADMRGADLRGADLRRADLRGANLAGAIGLDQSTP